MKNKIPIEELLEQIGRPYEMYNEDGTYQGCFYPVQVLYPYLPKFKMPNADIEEACEFALEKLKENCIEIHNSDLKMGDIITTNFKDILHIAIYLEFGKIIHVFKNHTLQIGRLKMFKDFQSFKVA